MGIDLSGLTQRQRRRLLKLQAELDRRERCARYEDSLYEFVKAAWPIVDKNPWQDSWVIEAICLHLEAVTDGRIKRLIINVPPRSGKTTIVNIMWPVWCWLQGDASPTSGPTVNFLCASYNQDMSLKPADAMRDLIESPWFQEHWGKRLRIRTDRNRKSDYTTQHGGRRQSTSITGQLLGLGGTIVMADDPHNTEQAESAAERETTLHGWKELSTTRLNDPINGAVVVVMQRLHEEDVTGHILNSEDAGVWTHLCIPMEFDSTRALPTYLGTDADGKDIVWRDPREFDGDLMWPERWDAPRLASIKRELGPYMYAGRFQQSPQPAKGGIVPREWWKLYDFDAFAEAAVDPRFPAPAGVLNYPMLEFVAVSVDTAVKEEEINDWNACTAWGVYRTKTGMPRIVLMEAWRWRGPLLGERLPADASELAKRAAWGLTERVLDTARRRRADVVLIEDKTRGHDLARELRRLLRQGECYVELVLPEGDKTTRLHACVPIFADGLVYAPDKAWAEMVISEVLAVPKGKHDDLADTVSQVLRWLRKRGLLWLTGEPDPVEEERRRNVPLEGSPYDV